MRDEVHVCRHPLVRHKLGILRDERTPPPVFRQLVRELSHMLFLEATADFPLAPYRIRTPVAECDAERLAWRIGLVPILRAGLGMAEAIQDLVPDTQVWHLGLYRDEESKQPVTYYNKLPERPAVDVCLVVDPMLATGGSAVAAIDIIKKWGVPRVRFLGLIAAPDGVAAMRTHHPDVPIYLTALDERLDERKFIVPGLGDAGDRQFGTIV